ncbi:MAG TPA: hypothetical protein VN843_02680 [Anaerolineales bacterium]|nr:hypothetical protein [Anaerolineales bacterium]
MSFSVYARPLSAGGEAAFPTVFQYQLYLNVMEWSPATTYRQRCWLELPAKRVETSNAADLVSGYHRPNRWELLTIWGFVGKREGKKRVSPLNSEAKLRSPASEHR